MLRAAESQARAIAADHGTPAYVYDEATLRRQALAALDFPNAFGLTVRFAMKALPNAAVLQIFDRLGLHIDASSGFEVRRAIAAGVKAECISLSSQELPTDLDELLALGIKFNACSLQQLRAYGKPTWHRASGRRVRLLRLHWHSFAPGLRQSEGPEAGSRADGSGADGSGIRRI